MVEIRRSKIHRILTCANAARGSLQLNPSHPEMGRFLQMGWGWQERDQSEGLEGLECLSWEEKQEGSPNDCILHTGYGGGRARPAGPGGAPADSWDSCMRNPGQPLCLSPENVGGSQIRLRVFFFLQKGGTVRKMREVRHEAKLFLKEYKV